MNINKINMTNFGAGNVFFKRVSPNNITSHNAIKKIAEDKDIDVFISKNKETKFLPQEDMYLIIASKEQPIFARTFFEIGKTIRHGMSCAIINKKAQKEELGVRIYNSAIHAIDVLEKKLAQNK